MKLGPRDSKLILISIFGNTDLISSTKIFDQIDFDFQIKYRSSE